MVSLIVPAYDEEEVIAAKVANALRLDWPRERLQVIVADDGSDRRDPRAGPRGRRRPRPRAAPRRQGRRAERSGLRRRRRAPRLLRRQQRVGAPTRSPRCSPPSPTSGSATSAARSASSTPGGDNLEGAYWRYEMAIRDDGVRARRDHRRQRRDLRGAPLAYEDLPPSGSHDLSFPFRLAKRGLRSLYAPCGARRGEDGADDRGRVRPQTADDGRPLGHRRRRRHADPARLLAALRLRALLPSAAPLRDARSSTSSSSSPTWCCSAAAGSTT